MNADFQDSIRLKMFFVVYPRKSASVEKKNPLRKIPQRSKIELVGKSPADIFKKNLFRPVCPKQNRVL
jgi:hypothetical protein